MIEQYRVKGLGFRDKIRGSHLGFPSPLRPSQSLRMSPRTRLGVGALNAHHTVSLRVLRGWQALNPKP